MRSLLAIAALLGAVLPAAAQEQIQVSVKVIEFQTGKNTETGLSAYFQQRTEPRPYGRVSSGNGTINSTDITFPSSTTAGVSVFLDRLVTKYGDVEIVLQGLVDEGRAFILSEPTALVPVGAGQTIIKTTQEVPYENTTVVGTTAVQTTNFKPTGVTLQVEATATVDDDGDPNTREDTYIRLKLVASVIEEGQRITVALDDSLAGAGGLFESAANEIRVPEFVTREIITEVWVRHGQVLMLGGLYRNTDDKDLATLPWLTQSDRFLNGLVQRVVPFAVEPVPISSSIGNNTFSSSRRELVFLIKADVPPPIFDVGVEAEQQRSIMLRPTDLVQGVLKDIAEIPQGLAEEVTGQSLTDGVVSEMPENESAEDEAEIEEGEGEEAAEPPAGEAPAEAAPAEAAPAEAAPAEAAPAEAAPAEAAPAEAAPEAPAEPAPAEPPAEAPAEQAPAEAAPEAPAEEKAP